MDIEEIIKRVDSLIEVLRVYRRINEGYGRGGQDVVPSSPIEEVAEWTLEGSALYRAITNRVAAPLPLGPASAPAPAPASRPMQIRQRWTEQERERFLVLMGQGVKVARLAELFGRTIPQIRDKLKVERLRLRQGRDEPALRPMRTLNFSGSENSSRT